jgi:hypothetical protein
LRMSLSDDLRDMGFVPTGEESPIDDSAELWTNGHELVCEESAIVIDGNHYSPDTSDVETIDGQRVYRYRNSGRVKMVGGFVGTYDWGDDGTRFKY